MEASTLASNARFLAPSGFVLGTEHLVSLQNSLLLLKVSEKFSQVRLWGRIKGLRADYFVAQGFYEDHRQRKKSFYSMDCITWAQLPDAHPLVIASCDQIHSHFTGSPSHEYTVTEPGPAENEERQPVPDELAEVRKEKVQGDGSVIFVSKITEELRMAAVIAAVDRDTSFVPRGAYSLTPTGVTETVTGFNGLSQEDAVKLSSYFHFRKESHVHDKPLVEQAKLNPSLDFLDPLSDDEPKGCWIVQAQNGGEAVALKSLHWPGFVGFHAPNTKFFGHVYNGNGVRNLDLAFML